MWQPCGINEPSISKARQFQPIIFSSENYVRVETIRINDSMRDKGKALARGVETAPCN
jgi:hypothetical protein